MRLFTILIAGSPIEDAFVYRTSIYCWTFENRLRIYSVAAVEKAARSHNRSQAGATNYALFHSRGVGASPEQARDWRRAQTKHWGDAPQIVLDAESIPYAEVRVDFEANDVLDVLIFYDRTYLATDNGLFSIQPFDPESSPERILGDPRVPGPCYAASAGLGTVAASCGPNGLQLLLDDVHRSSDRRDARKAAAESIRAEVGYGSVVNHRSRSDFEFLAATTEKHAGRRVISGVKPAKLDRATEFDATSADGPSDVEFTLWDRSRLLVFRKGTVVSIGVSSTDDQRSLTRSREVGTYGNTLDRVLSASRVGRYFALETDDAVAIVGRDQTSRTETGPVVSLRSYPRSFRYQRLATVTSTRGLWLLGVAD